MKTLFALAISIFFLHACSSANSSPADSNPPKKGVVKSGQDIPGQKLYKKYCMLCHGKNGDRGINGAGDLSKTAMTLEEKIEIIANGKGTMTPFKELLKENEIRQVAEYVGTLAK